METNKNKNKTSFLDVKREREREKEAYSPRIESGMANHDVTIDRDRENAEEADCYEPVSQERKQSAQERTIHPRTVPECRGCER